MYSRESSKYVLEHQSTLTMTQVRLVQHDGFPGDQKCSPDVAASKTAAALEAEESGWEEQAGSQSIGKAQRGLQRKSVWDFEIWINRDRGQTKVLTYKKSLQIRVPLK